MTEGELLAKAVEIAAQVHAKAMDKAGAPYILHPLRLLSQAETPAEKMVAILHDVIEDDDNPDPALRWTWERLAAIGFPAEVLGALELVTRRESDTYDAFIERIATADGEAGAIARRVKLLDLVDNMDVRRLADVTEKDAERLRRYHKHYQRLKALVR